MTYPTFKLKGRLFHHLGNGWCAHEVTRPRRSGTAFRMFWGVLQAGAKHPSYVTAYSHPDGDGGFVDLPDLATAAAWVDQRRVAAV